MFLELAARTKDGVQSTAAGRPVDLLIDAVMDSSCVMCLFQPLPALPAVRERPEPYKKGDKSEGKGKYLKGYVTCRRAWRVAWLARRRARLSASTSTWERAELRAMARVLAGGAFMYVRSQRVGRTTTGLTSALRSRRRAGASRLTRRPA